MPSTMRKKTLGLLAAATPLALVLAPLPMPAAAAPAPVVDSSLARSPELSETKRLADRRVVVTGDRAWALGTADGYYPAAGFHTRGEMGGFWLPNVKLLDGMWFGIEGDWIGPATRTTSGWGYVRADLPTTNGVRASRTDFVPDGVSGALVGLSLRANRTRTIEVTVDAHSELLGSYPWGETTPSQITENLPDSADVVGAHLEFRDEGTPPHENAEHHDWAAAVGADLPLAVPAPITGEDFRGPQDPAVICPASGPNAPPQPERCDDTEYGKGMGGRLTYSVQLRAGEVRTVWFGVGGSATGPDEAREQLAELLANPEEALADKVDQRNRIERRTEVDLPGNRLVEDSVRWSKQMLAASEQRVEDLDLRWVDAGAQYPPPAGTLESMRWFGAGWPDYTWLFGTDGEYTAYAAVAAGQFAVIKDHLRALRDVSDVINPDSGKIVHEVTPDGAVYFGADADEGNTDESSKFPSAVALVWRWTGDEDFLDDLYPASKRAMEFVASLDEDGDGWPAGLGNVERPGMGEEKLDNAVYTIRGYADLADMAAAVGDAETRTWALGKAGALLDKFEDDWWYGGDTRSYADSLGADNEKIFQRHWIGLTPTDAVLPQIPGRAAGPLASRAHANATLNEHEEPCYTDTYGLFHTGTGPTSAPSGNPGPSCDTVVSAVPSERNVFTLNSAIAAVSEGNYGRLGRDQQLHYIRGNALVQLDPKVWEMPGMMPEISPSPDFGANIERLFTERSMVMQAWGAYGVLWPVVHHWLGVSPDLGRGRLAVVPQLPPKQDRASAKRIRLGDEVSIDVAAQRRGKTYLTEVRRHGDVQLTIGAVVPRGSEIRSVRLDGDRIQADLVQTARGLEVRVPAGGGSGVAELRVTIR